MFATVACLGVPALEDTTFTTTFTTTCVASPASVAMVEKPSFFSPALSSFDSQGRRLSNFVRVQRQNPFPKYATEYTTSFDISTENMQDLTDQISMKVQFYS